MGKAWCGAGGELLASIQRGGREQAPVERETSILLVLEQSQSAVLGPWWFVGVVRISPSSRTRTHAAAPEIPPEARPSCCRVGTGYLGGLASPCCIASPVGLKTDGNIPVPIRSIFYFVRSFLCLWDSVFVFTKVEMRFLHPFMRNPVFT